MHSGIMEEDLSLNLQEKQAVVAEVSAQVAKAQTIVLAEYRGIKVGDITILRANARKSGVYFHVLKNTLARRAVIGTPFESLADQMVGPMVYSISADAVAAAKVVHEFAKTNDKLVVKAGSYNGRLLDAAGINALASIPSREVWHKYVVCCSRRFPVWLACSPQLPSKKCLLPSLL
jgi:large subunit ribosomal protein L10